MKITRTQDGWIIRVPDEVAGMLKLDDGCPVTIRPIWRCEDAVRIGLAEIRGKMPEYTFDATDWDGITVEQTNEHAIDLSPIGSRTE